MKKIVRLTESDIKGIVKNVLNEIVYDASDRNEELFGDLRRSFDEFYDYLYDYIRPSDDYDYNGEWLDDVANNNPQIQEIRKHAEIIKDILDKTY